MTDKPRDSGPQPVRVLPLDGGGSLRIWSAEGWRALTGQGDHATLSTQRSSMPDPAPTLEPEDGSTATESEFADNG
jgi:hypothetical protein